MNKTNTEVISDHVTFLKSKFNLQVDEEKKINFIKILHKNLIPSPKLHKNPSKARLFIATSQCCVKSLSKAITAELVFKQIEPHNSKPC